MFTINKKILLQVAEATKSSKCTSCKLANANKRLKNVIFFLVELPLHCSCYWPLATGRCFSESYVIFMGEKFRKIYFVSTTRFIYTQSHVYIIHLYIQYSYLVCTYRQTHVDIFMAVSVYRISVHMRLFVAVLFLIFL